MYTQSQFLNLTVEDYFKLERERNLRYEYIAGHVYAMSGGSEEHDLISGNIYIRLRTHLRGSNCRVFSSDMKVKIEALNIFYYSGISVTCDSQDREKYFKKFPCLLVEVLSPSTERIDRNEKLLNYQQLETLQEYVLVSQEEIKVEVYRKDSQGNWLLEILSSADVLNLSSVGLKIMMAEIYEDVES